MLKIGDKVRVASLAKTKLRCWVTTAHYKSIGKIYTVEHVYTQPAVRLSNTHAYHLDDLQKVSNDTPYKNINTEPQLFDINNLCEV